MDEHSAKRYGLLGASSAAGSAKRLAVVTLHGMGMASDGYADGLKAKLAALLGDAWNQVSFHAIHYQHIHQQSQDQLWQDIENQPDNDVANRYLRRFFLYHFSDALSLERGRCSVEPSYQRIQEAIGDGLTHVHQTFGPGQEYPVIFIAHSLGCQVISNYLWDKDQGQNFFDQRRPKWQQLDNLSTLVTLGCNIPVFTAGLAKRQAFRPPNEGFRWHNFYDPDDILGWPVRQLGRDFERMATDFAVNAGGIFTSWNFFSHMGYWTDWDIVHHIAQLIGDQLNAKDPKAALAANEPKPSSADSP